MLTSDVARKLVIDAGAVREQSARFELDSIAQKHRRFIELQVRATKLAIDLGRDLDELRQINKKNRFQRIIRELGISESCAEMCLMFALKSMVSDEIWDAPLLSALEVVHGGG